MIILISEYNFTPCFCIFIKIFFSGKTSTIHLHNGIRNAANTSMSTQTDAHTVGLIAYLVSCVRSSFINRRQL